MHSILKKIFIGLSLALLVTTTYAQQSVVTPVEDDVVLTKDTLEGFNRGSYKFNDGWDQVLFRPVINGYTKVVPSGPRRCIHGFFENLKVPYTAVNNLLQGKLKAAGQDICRFVVNTTVGVGGCIDVASKWNIPKHEEDFGQTLGVWGVPSGPFINLPLLGPSTVRDASAKFVDFFAGPIGYIRSVKLSNSLTGFQVLDTRASLQQALDLVDDTAIDRYTFLRDAWLQQREAQVRDEDYAPDDVPLSATASNSAEMPEVVAEQRLNVAEAVAPAPANDALAQAELMAQKINAPDAEKMK
ncbi:MlaA family lipoprotein [Hydromonas duriensis]|uniref:Phospholipid-binding lipoprotein MlaA n=1 Tax=Hydromonas duriensis TaxID=1527608 RepID=A0A4R6Y6R9_9BURK|nr:VacJ family lipoprotein [Hydromonas duriensis]TDR30977.1 phospholipid-binding lipoprotein MlaA [Hydromonas duriensis]